MTALTKGEENTLRKLLTKMISGSNGQQMRLFSLLWELDTKVNYEDNYATRRHWYIKWFELAFCPRHIIGERTPRINDKIVHLGNDPKLTHTYGKVVGLVIDWGDNRRSSIYSTDRIKVHD